MRKELVPGMYRYAIRYVPLLLLALLLILMHVLPWLKSNTSGSSGPQSGFASPWSALTLYGVALTSAQEGWAVGGTFVSTLLPNGSVQHVQPESGTILHYHNGSWVADATLQAPLLSISMPVANDGWAVGYAGQLAHYNGQSWQSLHAPINAVLHGVSMLSSQDGWAVGFGGVILHWQGQRWLPVASPTREDLLSVSMVSGQEGWAVGAYGTILHYSGGVWQMSSSPTGNTLNSVFTLSAQEAWTVGEQGTILHYRDGTWETVQWTSTPNPNYPSPGFNAKSLRAIVMTSEHAGWIVGDGYLLHYDHEVWEDQSSTYSGFSADAIALSSPTEGWTVDSDQGIYHYQGGQWQLYKE
jgi:photosystem II stability/assembly factor-like uncharacterized protein